MTGSWHKDPWRRNEGRWFDGKNWTERVRNQGIESMDVVGESRPTSSLPPPSLADPQANSSPYPPPTSFTARSTVPSTSTVGPAKIVRQGLLQWMSYRLAFFFWIGVIIVVGGGIAFAVLWKLSDSKYRSSMKTQVCAELEMFRRSQAITTFQLFINDADRLSQSDALGQSARIIAHSDQVTDSVRTFAVGVFLYECGLVSTPPDYGSGIDLSAEARKIDPNAPIAGSISSTTTTPSRRTGQCPKGGVDVIQLGDGVPTPCPDVRRVQQILADMGYGVTPNGQFRSATEGAVSGYQTDHGMPPTGKVDPALWARLVG